MLLSTNPSPSNLLERAERVAEEIGGQVEEFLFDGKKHLAYVTIRTDHDNPVTFAQIVALLEEIDPDGIYGIGPLNVWVE
jgi:hypothetical protein